MAATRNSELSELEIFILKNCEVSKRRSKRENKTKGVKQNKVVGHKKRKGS